MVVYRREAPSAALVGLCIETLDCISISISASKLWTTLSYALASTYGAVGAVTFSVGLSFLKNQGVTSEGYLAAILAVLEPVAFILAIFLTNMAVSKQINAKKQSFTNDSTSDIDVGLNETKIKLSKVLRESVTGKAIVILLGSIVIGYIIGEEGFGPIKFVFDELFTGAIVIFMIEMGIIAGQRLDDIKKVGLFLTSFALLLSKRANSLLYIGVTC